MQAPIPILLLIIISFFCCKNRTVANTNDQKIDKIFYDSNEKAAQDSTFNLPELKSNLNVSAYLIYDDGTLSDFNVLSNKAIALWNVMAGGGDALKPSNSTLISFSGNLDSLNINIKNGNKLVIDTATIGSKRKLEYIIKNTGCFEVYVNVTRNMKTVYNDTIPFHCGE
jgi:hypothetical protein